MIIKNFRKIIFFVSFAFIVSFSLLCFVIFEYIISSKNSEVVFLDVGQGDSILIKTRNGQNILIDAGSDSRVLDRIGRHLPFFDKKIDILIATHPDSDHIGGISSVLDRFSVGLVIDTGVLHSSGARDSMIEKISLENISINYISSRVIYEFGDGMFLDLLYPLRSFEGIDIEDNNLASIVAKFTDNEIDFMLTGDAPVEVEEELVKIYGAYLSSEVLKAGHHGSKTSSAREFLFDVNPEVVVVSVGKDNKYGHPDKLVMESFISMGAIVFRTDKVGDISFLSDGRVFRMR